jgi:glutathione peroxidase
MTSLPCWIAAALVLGACMNNEPAQAPESPPAQNETMPAAAEGAAAPTQTSETSETSAAPSIHGLTLKRLDGTEAPLSAWAGKVLLIVNTASKCGYTPQYQGLQQLHAKYSERGFAVLGFPSNDFGGQEPGSAEEIANFCITMYDVNFPMFEKIKTVGKDRSTLYTILSDARGEPKWNFHKYLIDKQGRPVQAWASAIDPGSSEIATAIEAQLGAQ